jgi:hypothetical protein
VPDGKARSSEGCATKEPERAWQELLELSKVVEDRVSQLEDTIASAGSRAAIAITEGHLGLSPSHANPILHEWLSAPYHARSFNIYQRRSAHRHRGGLSG